MPCNGGISTHYAASAVHLYRNLNQKQYIFAL
jgi:hypothetical protein